MVVLHQYNASTHMVLSVKQLLTSKNITVMGNPPYSPDLAACDFFYLLRLNFAEREPILFQLKSSGKNGESSKGTSKNLVPELLPTVPNAEMYECRRKLL
ncbi:hypothetical protein TNCV_3971661 [Trichonephila clavipes]|nr:hypothetical protein TNCV_3971661 [Trichonephila clavipes]